MKTTSRNWRFIIAATVTGTLGVAIATGYAVRAKAQETLASVGAATAAGAGLGAAAGGFSTPSQYAAPATRNKGQATTDLINDASNAGAMSGNGAGAGGAQVSVRVSTQAPPLRWGPGSGDDMVREVTRGGRYPARDRVRRSPAGAAAYSRRLAHMTPRQRSRMVMSKYHKPAIGYLAWYLPEDRYKVSSKVWQFVTTPNDRFYYRPWAPAMKLRSPSRVIGFHTWQDALVAGYHPDPVTQPEPASDLTRIARYTRGPNLSTYIEYLYAGQITPSNFEQHMEYINYIVREVGGHEHTRRFLGATVEQVLGAFVGNGAFPTSVGDPVPVSDVKTAGMSKPGGANGGPPPGLEAGNGDKREEDYNKFSNRAGALANTPGNR